MIIYSPDGEVSGPISWRVRTCFIMAVMGEVPPEVSKVRKKVVDALHRAGYTVIDASSKTTGRDYLMKIWSLAASAPVGVAIVHEGIRPETMANIFYELAYMHSYGRETIVVKIGNVALPSDLVRTEYIHFNKQFALRFKAFISSLEDQAEYYLTLAANLEKNPLLAIDYLRRNFMLSGDKAVRARAKKLFEESGLAEREIGGVEHNFALWATN
jgi:hypothetical protein